MNTSASTNENNPSDFSVAQNQPSSVAIGNVTPALSPLDITVKVDENFSSSVENIEQKISDDLFDEKIDKPSQKISAVYVLKNATIFVWVMSLFAYAWFFLDLEPNNNYLKHIGLVENTGKKYERLVAEQGTLLEDIQQRQTAIESIKTKIETQDFSDLEGSIASIQEGQMDWYDRVENNTYVFGMMDMFAHLSDYFNSRYYEDPEKIISGRKDQVIIKDFSVNRDGADINVQVSHVLGRVFFLANEFVDMVNAVPFLKNGSINSYSRQKNDIGDDTMEFSMNLERQFQASSVTTDFVIDQDDLTELEDLNDLRFAEFIDWFKQYKQPGL